MNKIKPVLIICSLLCFLATAILILISVKNREHIHQKIILAQEMRGVLENVIFDLSEAREDTIRGVPADGLWHHRIDFFQKQLGPMEYVLKGGRMFRINDGRILMVADNMGDLRLRRLKEAPDIMEAQIEVKNKVTMTINLKIRLHR